MLSSERDPRRLPLLDGLRGVAAIAVMLYHARNFHLRGQLFEANYLFVDLFFLLSGFVLTLSAEPRLGDLRSSAAFLRARVRRVWPTIAIGIGLGAAMQFDVVGAGGTPLYVLFALLFIPAVWRRDELFPLNGPQWSLFWELLANAVHATILHRLSERSLMAVVAAGGAGLIAIIWGTGNDMSGTVPGDWWLAAPRVAFPYCLGILFARRWRRSDARNGAPWWAIVIVPPIVVMLAPYVLASSAVRDSLIAVLGFPVLFWLAIEAAPAPAVAERWMARLGGLSFPLYAVHLPVLALSAQITRSPLGVVIGVSLSLALAIVVAPLTAPQRRTTGPCEHDAPASPGAVAGPTPA